MSILIESMLNQNHRMTINTRKRKNDLKCLVWTLTLSAMVSTFGSVHPVIFYSGPARREKIKEARQEYRKGKSEERKEARQEALASKPRICGDRQYDEATQHPPKCTGNNAGDVCHVRCKKSKYFRC